MSESDFVTGWVRIYTAGLPGEARDARRAEIESDLWEHVAFAWSGGVAASAIRAQIVARCVLGMWSDLAWRRAQARRSWRTERKGEIVMSERLRRDWWIPAPLLLAAGAGWTAIIVLIGGRAVGDSARWNPNLWVRLAEVGFYAALATALLAAVALRNRRPGMSVGLILVPAMLSLLIGSYGYLLVGALGLVTILGASLNKMRSSLEHPAPVRTARTT